MIDLRSDTVTKPSAAMKNVMMNAEVGDDVFAEDPSINLLQERVANYFGKEAGLFCPSGTMTNQIAIQVHTNPGDEVICSKLAHVYLYEGGGIAKNSGCSVRLIDSDRGLISAEAVKSNINPKDAHYARTSLVCVEDTCNKGGGSCYDLDSLESIREACQENGLNYHLDGARVFNALVAKGHDPIQYGQLFDSISVCFSKGMGAPVGSVLLGSRAFIEKAHRIRKSFGGGMRQAGYLASAALCALENNIDRLQEDHKKASALSEALKECALVDAVSPVETNIVIFKLKAGLMASEVLERLKSNSVLAVPFGPDMIRFVTHLDVSDNQIKECCEIIRNLK